MNDPRVAATTPSDRTSDKSHYRSTSPSMMAAELWASYDSNPKAKHPTLTELQLEPYSARQADDSKIAVGIWQGRGLPTNLRYFANTGEQCFFTALKTGEYTPCSKCIEATEAVVTECYFTALIINSLCNSNNFLLSTTYVICAHTSENMLMVADQLQRSGQFYDVAVAPADPSQVDSNHPPVSPKLLQLWFDARRRRL